MISPKTAHNPAGGQRIIPLFPELTQPLLDASEAAPDGAVYVVSKHRSQADSPGGWKSANLRPGHGPGVNASGKTGTESGTLTARQRPSGHISRFGGP